MDIIEQTKNAEKIIENATEQEKDNEMGFTTQDKEDIKQTNTLSDNNIVNYNNNGDTVNEDWFINFLVNINILSRKSDQLRYIHIHFVL